jgi:uncharacterized membrane protein
LIAFTVAWVALLVIAQAASNNDHTVSNTVWAVVFLTLAILIVLVGVALVQSRRKPSG